MKNLILLIVALAVSYFALAGILTITKVCPEYMNYMPSPEESNTPSWQPKLCIFSKKAY